MVVLSTAGDHVPVIPFVEVVCKPKLVPIHIGPIAAKVGVGEFIVKLTTVVSAEQVPLVIIALYPAVVVRSAAVNVVEVDPETSVHVGVPAV